jgi:hypothetical protein
MIIFEEQLARIVDVLPPFIGSDSVEFPINYNWGTIEDLNKYLLLPTDVSKYPLIWLANGQDTHDLREPSVKRNARIIIATRSLNVDELNPYQYQNDFKVILQPIVDNLLNFISISQISRYNKEDVKTERKPNYSVTYRKDNENKTEIGQIDVWNAIILDVEISFFNIGCEKIFN